MSEQEKAIVNNIANKLDIVLYKNKITILGLSRLLKIDKQPLYRIMKREHIPNISFLEIIGNYLNCTVLELIDKNYFIDIDSYYNVNDQNQSQYERYRIYIYDDNFMSVVDKDFFGILSGSCLNVYYKTSKITHDGYYLIQEGNNILEEVNILSVGTSLIIALINNTEVRLNHTTTTVIAKLYKTVSILQSEEHAVKY